MALRIVHTAGQPAAPAVPADLFPAFGLHWMSGLLQLREGAVGAALVAFAKELDEARESSVYFREFRVNALLGAGYGHLSIGDAAGAADAFRMALESLPSNGRALLGLEQALSQMYGIPVEVDSFDGHRIVVARRQAPEAIAARV